ncbi:calsequestrin-1-like [Anarrhichthys ocellatus]|uniref:calsequestrin-1-like n=1 Tax=Anarrhichthys ocellatus TaxID=433405 RepID=UPI0012EE183E|nr:calsequestrin-1-like [Anarrhichthys ocellatus]
MSLISRRRSSLIWDLSGPQTFHQNTVIRSAMPELYEDDEDEYEDEDDDEDEDDEDDKDEDGEDEDDDEDDDEDEDVGL